MTEPAPIAVYIHWPFCSRICPYCDFNVVRDRGRTLQQLSLVNAIAADLAAQAALVGARRLVSVFFGGGTPSLMDPDWIGRLIEVARRLWPTEGPVEISLEANPTDAEAGRFAAFVSAGVGRLSLGVQSFDDEALSFLGRNHDAAAARRALDLAVRSFPRVSLDLIYALPGQTPKDWEAQLVSAVASGVEHISPYQLTIEAGTAFDRQVKRGAFAPPGPDAGAALYETTQIVLSEAGFEAYEVSNHARGEAARAVHNLAYWRGWDYVGAGPGAHGRISMGGVRVATEAEHGIDDYLASVARSGLGFRTPEPLGPREVAVERLLMGLRTSEGVDMTELAFLELAGLDQMRSAGLLDTAAGRLVATPEGRAVLDRITAELCA